MTDSYKDYFKNHFNSKFDPMEMDLHARFLRSQFLYMKKKTDISDLPKKRILEVGSGLGALAKLLFEEGARDYTGLDLDQDVVSFTNKTLGKHFFARSVEEFDPGERKFDYIFALEVLEHLPDPSSGLLSINRLLKADGTLVATTPYPFVKNILSDRTHHFVLHPLGWSKLLKELGFRDVRTYPMSLFPYLWRIQPSLNMVIPFYVPFNYWVSTSLILARK